MTLPEDSAGQMYYVDPAEAYGTIAELPDDEALRETIKLYSDQHLLTIKAAVTAAQIDGLPAGIKQAWAKAEAKEVTLSSEAHENPQATIQDLVKEEAAPILIPAYKLWVTAGMNMSRNLSPTMLIKLDEPHSGLSVFLRRHGNHKDESFEITDGFGKDLGEVSQESVTAILNSLANIHIEGLATLPAEDQHATLLHYIGEHFGRRRSEYRLAASLGKASLRNLADEYAGVILVEDETPSSSAVSFVLEHLLKHTDLDADVVHRMTANYFGAASLPEADDDSDIDPSLINKVTMVKIIGSDTGYSIDQLSTAKEMKGTKRELSLGPDEVVMLHNILEQVIASVANRFIPEELPPRGLPTTEEQL